MKQYTPGDHSSYQISSTSHLLMRSTSHGTLFMANKWRTIGCCAVTVTCSLFLTIQIQISSLNSNNKTHLEMRYPNMTELYFATPLAFNAPNGGVPWMISVKFCMEVKGWIRYKKKYCQKFQPRVGRTNVTGDKQMTDGFATAKT